MQEIRDYTKEKIGSLTPLNYRKSKGKILWTCKCDCGNIIERHSILLGLSLKNNIFSTCGCLSRNINGQRKTIVGCTFRNFTIKAYNIDKKVYLCEHKNKIVELTSIQVNNKIKNFEKHYESYCEKERFAINMGCNDIDDYNKKSTQLHHILYLIKERCYDKKCWAYNYYGGRGIKVYQEWLENSKSFVEWALLNGYKKGLEIDRINNDSDYTPTNCRWITKTENMNNRSNNSYIEHNGKIKTLAEWCRELNLDYKYTHYKVRYKGFTIQQVIDYIKKKESGF